MSIRIEFPSRGATYCHQKYGVYKYGIYPSHSVLAGQESRTFLNDFETLEEAQTAYPEAEVADGSRYQKVFIPQTPPDWFEPVDAGERWNEDY